MPAKNGRQLRAAELELGARVAWSYLASVAAAALGGLVTLVLAQFLPSLACGRFADSVETQLACEVVLLPALFAVLFLLALLALLRPMGLDVWLLAALTACLFGMLLWGRIDAWWWWATFALLPAVSALASADWFGHMHPTERYTGGYGAWRPGWSREVMAQRTLLLVLAVATVCAFVASVALV
jgi:hypothetical protein